MNSINSKYSLKAFESFAAKLADDTRVRIVTNGGVDALVPPENEGEFDATQKDVGVGSRILKTDAGIGHANENNFVRTKLMEALSSHYKGKIPAAVRRALVGTSLAGAHDMDGWGSDEGVTSGRPLTARRIKAVMTAVKTYDASHPEYEEEDLEQLAKENTKNQFDTLMDECRFESLNMSDSAASKSVTNKMIALSRNVESGGSIEVIPKFFNMLVKMATHPNPEVAQYERKRDGSVGYLIVELRKVMPKKEAEKIECLGRLANDSSLSVLKHALRKSLKGEEFRKAIDDYKNQAESQHAMTVALLEGFYRVCFEQE